MERESNPMEALCRSGCGFYGNPSTDGLCSVCFKEALKKKQQPPATTPSPVAAPFVPAAPALAPAPTPAPAPAPTPLAAAAPTVPSLSPQPQQHTDSKWPNRNKKKYPIMENDPNKKESKGKRLLKKALRRNSKTSNNSQSSALEQSLSASLSKSSEKKRQSIDVKDSAPLPTADGAKEKPAGGALRPQALEPAATDDRVPKKMVGIKESRNEIFQEPAAVSESDHKDKSLKLDSTSRLSGAETSKKVLKRKLEEESGAGTSGASTGASDTDADDKDPSKDKKKKNRCAVCRKKVGLTGFECRCGGLFCAVHRYSDKHDCSFDYRELGAQEIRRNNPVVVSQKIHKI